MHILSLTPPLPDRGQWTGRAAREPLWLAASGLLPLGLAARLGLACCRLAAPLSCRLGLLLVLLAWAALLSRCSLGRVLQAGGPVGSGLS